MGDGELQASQSDGNETEDGEKPAPSDALDVTDVSTMDSRSAPMRIDSAQSDTIELHVSMNVADMAVEDRAVLIELAGLFEDNFRELVNKNRRYGWSFIHTGAERAQLPGGQYENSIRATADGLFTRSGDKRRRFHQMMFNNIESSNEHPAVEAARENANYWLLMALVVKNPDLVSDLIGGLSDR
jgi:hypothetical protein